MKIMKNPETLMRTTIKDMGIYDDNEMPILNLERTIRHLYNNYQPTGREIYTELVKFIASSNTITNDMNLIFDKIIDANSKYTEKLCNKPTIFLTEKTSLINSWISEVNTYNHLNANCCKKYQKNIINLNNHMRYILLELFTFMEKSYHKSKIDYHDLIESDLDFIIKAPRKLKLGSRFDMQAYHKLLLEQEDTIAYNFTSVKTLIDFIFNGKDICLKFFNAPSNNANMYITKAIEYFDEDITIKTIDKEEYRESKIIESIINHRTNDQLSYFPNDIRDTVIMSASISYQYAYFIAKKICIILKIIDELNCM